MFPTFKLIFGLAARVCWLFAPAFLCGVLQAEESQSDIEFFESRIRPALVEHCFRCHSPESEKVEGGLLLHTREAARKGGDSGPAVVPGSREKSLLIEAIRYEGLEMPPDRKLPDRVIADFERWIDSGAADPRAGEASAIAAEQVDIKAGKEFWAFQHPQRNSLPPVESADWPRRRIDYFILQQIESAGLAPSPEASRESFIRRAAFALIGLPPTPAEISAFLADDSANAEERLVDRLLASPAFGEHWARLWLDVARYAEDQAHIVGNDESLLYPNAYLYRDWVIKALNADMPYDEFVKLQLAADRLAPEDGESQAALGFLGLGPKYYRRGSLDVMADEWEDRVDTVARGLLGLTVACARCHDHKFDPIPTQDYYALAGVFASTKMFNRPLDDKREKEKDGEAKSPKDALHIVREGEPHDLNVFIRGKIDSKGPLAPRRFLSVLSRDQPEAFEGGSGRLDLAEEIVDPHNPLTARVIVNRVWKRLFGRGLVATPSNFGALGERPTHPQLLDDLALRLIESGWSLKWLVRELALSSAYGQTSRVHIEQIAADPENRLLARMTRRRLNVEEWRDAVLAASGRLDGRVGGRSIDPQDAGERRRTVYSRISRLDLNPMLALFDFPDPNVHAAARAETTTPLQRLFMMNSPFMIAQADALAARLSNEIGGGDYAADEARIALGYRLLFAREPTTNEISLGLEFLQADSSAGDSSAQPDAWKQYAHVLLTTTELQFVD